MDVKNLFKAASTLEARFPDLSDEIIKIAQELGNVDQTFAQPVSTDLNPNIKNFATPSQQPEEDKSVHKITFTIEVPKEWGELEIMNELLPVLKSLQQRDAKLIIKGYQFTQS